MKMSYAPRTSAQASASDSITVFRAGTYVDRNRIGSRAVFRHVAVAQQSGSAKRGEVYAKLSVRFRADCLGDLSRSENLMPVSLAVLDRERIHVESRLARDRRGGIRVEASAQEHDGLARRPGHVRPKCACGSAAEAARAAGLRESSRRDLSGRSTPCTGEKSTAAHLRSSACRATMSRANS